MYHAGGTDEDDGDEHDDDADEHDDDDDDEAGGGEWERKLEFESWNWANSSWEGDCMKGPVDNHNNHDDVDDDHDDDDDFVPVYLLYSTFF